MTQEHLSNEEFGRIADEVYETRIRPVVETDENIGKMLILDIITGDYEIDEMQNSLAMNKRMLTKYPAERLAGYRIGYDAIWSFGGYRPVPSKR